MSHQLTESIHDRHYCTGRGVCYECGQDYPCDARQMAEAYRNYERDLEAELDDDPGRAYEAGYDDGYAEGKREGYDDGYEHRAEERPEPTTPETH